MGDSKISDSLISSMINVTIKTIDSKNYQFEVENDIQIKAFKEKIAPMLGIEPESQRMIYCGRVLADDKTLKDYNIDNGKVIHLVKRTPQPKNDTPSNSTNQQQNESNNRTRFRSFRNESGSSVFMGTWDSQSNILDQVMRQIFFPNRSGSNENSDSSGQSQNFGNNSNSSIPARFNQMRQLLAYIETNFQILQNPSHVPVSQTINFYPENRRVPLHHYASIFREALSYLDRLKPHINTWLESFNNTNQQQQSSENEDLQNNASILMRIVHHLSHLLHSLTDFSIDPNSENPITLNILENQSTPNELNINIPASNSSQNNNTAPTNEDDTSNNDDSVDNQSPLSNSTNPIGTNANINPLPRNIFTSQSPILLMEVDATMNDRSGRSFPNFSISDFNITFNNLINNARNVTINTLNPNSNNSSRSNDNNSTSSQPQSSTNQSSTPSSIQTQGDENSSSTTTNDQRSSPSNNEFSNSNPLHTLFTMRFDRFLHCNSRYTLPEIRSATNVSPRSLGSSLPDSLNPILFPSPIESAGVPRGLISSLLNLFRADIDPLEIADNRRGREFFELIAYLIERMNQLPDIVGNGSEDLESYRITDYLRPLNLFDSDSGESFMSNILSLLFQNLNFQDLYQIINFDFHGFDRLREPLQNFIQTNLLNDQEWSRENVSQGIDELLTRNQILLQQILSEQRPLPGINIRQSFENFARATLVEFFDRIMQSNDSGRFEEDLIASIKFLVTSYIQFCNVCFTDPVQARNNIITSFMDQCTEFVDTRIRTFMANVIRERVDSLASMMNSENDSQLVDRINGFVIRTSDQGQTTTTTTTRQESQPINSLLHENENNEAINNSCGSEEFEFSDAISDTLSANNNASKNESTTTITNPNGEEKPADWEAVLPKEWVPIIKDDIEKQKKLSKERKPPFSDAYKNAMSKRRRRDI